MAIIFSRKVYSAGLSGVVTAYTTPEINSLLGSAEKIFCQLRAAQTSGTASVAVTLQSSIDGIDWKDRTTLISQSLSAGQINYYYGTDAGTSNVFGGMQRLRIDLAGTSPSTVLDIWLTGRSIT